MSLEDFLDSKDIISRSRCSTCEIKMPNSISLRKTPNVKLHSMDSLMISGQEIFNGSVHKEYLSSFIS